MGGSQDIEVLNLAHIRSEYMFVLSRLQLANEIPSLSQPGSSQTSETYLNGLTLVKMFLNQGRVMDAFEKATVLGTDIVPLFITLTQSFCRLTLEGSQGSNHFNFQWVNEAVLHCILSTSRNVKVPRWLLDQFFTRKPDTLLSFFFKFDLLSDAFTCKNRTTRSIPLAQLNHLLNLTSFDLHSSSPSNINRLNQAKYDGLNELALKSL
ncbi:hypothetical protein Pst134EB_023884 [Puccinia striiformis f. sp. tritici]|nr:hypothetical protein Pst134EB_023884 [Puccinia striiformis f. sp. tritici]